METVIRKKVDRLFAKAVKARDLGDYKQARRWWLKAVELRPLPLSSRGPLWIMVADCERKLGDYRQALRSMRLAERCSPRSVEIQEELGLTLLDFGRPKLAERALRKAIKLKPTADAYILLAEALSRRGMDDEVKTCWQAALKLEPDNEMIHYDLGIWYLRKRQLSLAERYLRRAIAIDSKYAKAYTGLGRLLVRKRQLQEARRVLRKSVRLNPEYLSSRLYLALATASLRKLKESEEQYRAALRIAPNRIITLVFYGDFLSAYRRREREGEEYLRKAVKVDPGEPLCLYYLGKHLCRWNREREALPYLRKAARKGHERAKLLFSKEMSKRDGTILPTTLKSET